MGLRERCKALYQRMQRDAMFCQGSPVDNLMSFVLAERRALQMRASRKTIPLCLYFGTHRDREQCIELIYEFIPKTVPKKMP